MSSRTSTVPALQAQPEAASASPQLRNDLTRAAALQAAGARAVQTQIDTTPIAERAHPEDFEHAVPGTAFVRGKNDASEVDPHDVHQNAHATDCWLLAALMTVARTNPGLIESMVQPAGNGAWHVSFYSTDWQAYLNWQPGQPSPRKTRKTVVVTDSFPVDAQGTPGYASVGETGAGGPELWVMLIEKAVAADMGGYHNLTTATSDMGLFLLTPDPLATQGHAGIDTIVPADLTPDALLDRLGSAFESGTPMVAGSSDFPNSFFDTRQAAALERARQLGMYLGHAHVFTAVDRRARTVSLEEPSQTRPLPHLSIEDFQQFFINVSIGAPRHRR